MVFPEKVFGTRFWVYTQKCEGLSVILCMNKDIRVTKYTLYFVVKPRVSLDSIHFYEKDKIINCSLTKVGINPEQMHFTWYSCGPSKCNKSNLIMISNSYSLRLKSQSNNRMNFRCEATNAAGSAYQDIVVVIHPSEFKKLII